MLYVRLIGLLSYVSHMNETHWSHFICVTSMSHIWTHMNETRCHTTMSHIWTHMNTYEWDSMSHNESHSYVFICVTSSTHEMRPMSLIHMCDIKFIGVTSNSYVWHRLFHMHVVCANCDSRRVNVVCANCDRIKHSMSHICVTSNVWCHRYEFVSFMSLFFPSNSYV